MNDAQGAIVSQLLKAGVLRVALRLVAKLLEPLLVRRGDDELRPMRLRDGADDRRGKIPASQVQHVAGVGGHRGHQGLLVGGVRVHAM
jgi:hypothetical protein